MSLRDYRRKRDFTRTSEPRGAKKSARHSFVVQKHAATRLHYDFRLELDGVLLSWAVPKGPSLNPADKRLAVRVEDHPVEYGSFEGTIPKGEYGGGSVLLWDRGTWAPVGDAKAGLAKGHLDFTLDGEKLKGGWRLIRMHGRSGEDDKNWLLLKRTDEFAKRGGRSITDERPESVSTGRSIDDIGDGAKKKTTNAAKSRPSSRSATRSSATKTTGKKSATKSKKTSSANPRDTKGAKRAALPGFVDVELATLVKGAPEGDDWIHEVKFDGYRMLVELDRGKVRWWSRNGLDWSDRFAELSKAIQALPATRALIDGEVVVLDEHGISHFQRLQNALNESGDESLTYFAFDLLHLDGYDLRGCTLLDRKNLLRALLSRQDANSAVRFSEHVESHGADFLRAACTNALEGVVSKRKDSTYHSGRGRDWTKAKCGHRQEFVVAGFTKPKGSRTGIGALALCVREEGEWRFVGRVGTGFDTRMLTRLRKLLEPLKRDSAPFAKALSSEHRRGVVWVEPRIVVEVSFAAWTSDGLLRHATFEGLREDKQPKSIVREEAVAVTSAESAAKSRARSASKSPPKRGGARETKREAKPATKRASTASDASKSRSTTKSSTTSDTVAGIRISHPERVMDTESGVTKLDLARYYEQIATHLLPHIANRPLSIMRCPDGFDGEHFFQKHAGRGFPPDVRSLPVRDSSGVKRYLMIDSVEGLISLVQMNAVEFHPWGSRGDDLESPDRMFFDLDPGEGVEWREVVDAALTVRDVLEHMKIESFVKTTGGKGLHVVVPLERKSTWDAVKSFSHGVAIELARAEPKRFVATAAKVGRKGRIFVDYLRNSRGATAVAPFSVRARAGAPVAVPIAWNKLTTLSSGAAFHLDHDSAWKMPSGRDPWAHFEDSGQRLPRSAKKNADE